MTLVDSLDVVGSGGALRRDLFLFSGPTESPSEDRQRDAPCRIRPGLGTKEILLSPRDMNPMERVLHFAHLRIFATVPRR